MTSEIPQQPTDTGTATHVGADDAAAAADNAAAAPDADALFSFAPSDATPDATPDAGSDSRHCDEPVVDLTDLGLGRPTATGRWQPTRAGVVNSWEWADETLHYADGWLALVGLNGSGKSLTASMLLTVLLDADTSQTALSVSNKAAGTLMSRHTALNENEDRTGVWWLEFGRRDDSGNVEYVTVGLWLRSTSKNLHKVFFVAAGRVGHEITLQTDRNVTHVDVLAGQLAACNGEMFTDQSSLRSRISQHLPAVGELVGYRNCVRTRLFAPMDEIQYDALISVLRSLRSVRTAENVSPQQMRRVLTDALPALDPQRLSDIAAAMQRISELETRLADTREQAKALHSTDQHYLAYRKAVTDVELAQLRAANTNFLNVSRDDNEAQALLTRSRNKIDQVQGQLVELGVLASRLRGEHDALDSAMKEHAGHELPLRRQHAEDQAEQASVAERHARDLSSDADQARTHAVQAADLVGQVQATLRSVHDDLRRTGISVGAAGALERLLAHSHDLLATVEPAALDVDELIATPLAWADERLSRLDKIKSALDELGAYNAMLQARADERRESELTQETAEEQAAAATQLRRDVEQIVRQDIQQWNSTLEQIDPLTGPPLQAAGDDETRLTDIALQTWLTSAAEQAAARIDVSGHRSQVREASGRAADAATAAAQAQQRSAAATGRVEQSQAELDEQIRADTELAAAAAQTAQQAEHDLTAARHAAASSRSDVHQHTGEQVDLTVRALHRWAGEVQAWTEQVHVLDPTGIADLPLPAPLSDRSDPQAADALLTSLIDLDVRQVERDVDAVARAARSAADRAVHDGEQLVDRIEAQLADLDDNIEQAQQAPGAPAAPQWRQRTGNDGSPLWSLVDFAATVTPDVADRLEGALLVAGLLDALVRPDGQAVAADVVLSPSPTSGGPSLADLLVVEPDSAVPAERVTALLRSIPLSDDGSDLQAGQLRHGVLLARAPEHYHAAFIGTSARERARRALLEQLAQQRAVVVGDLEAAERELQRSRERRHSVDLEQQALPAPTEFLTVLNATRGVHAQRPKLLADIDVRERDAVARHDEVLRDLQARAQQRAATIGHSRDRLRDLQLVAAEAEAAAAAAQLVADERATSLQQARATLAEAETAQQRMEGERAAFPDLDPLRQSCEEEDRADLALQAARAAAAAAADRYEEVNGQVGRAFKAVHRAATLPDGQVLATEQTQLATLRKDVNSLRDRVGVWSNTTVRAVEMLTRAAQARQAAAVAQDKAASAQLRARELRERAEQARAAVAQMEAAYGQDYAQLKQALDSKADELRQSRERKLTLDHEELLAQQELVRAQTQLENIAPKRVEAEQVRAGRLQSVLRLVEEGMGSPTGDIAVDEHGRPANLTAALAWASSVLPDPKTREGQLDSLSARASNRLARLERDVNNARSALLRFDRQVTLPTIEGTPWRRAVVASPEAGGRGQDDLHDTVAALHASAEQLEADLRDDIKSTLKNSLFTALRKDIAARRQTALELVRQIRTTLKTVRTGVARVGVEVDWRVKDDADAQQMVALINAVPSDETFDQMYEVLRARMDETAGEPWEDRVAHTFDYRGWHEWDIRVTHASFGNGTVEQFRPVTVRSNPLDSLSTGEKRLATMLPLLAAAWQMYSDERFQGPRMLSIDELDAAFDDNNLRQVLTLLRRWNFDVLATAPHMAPMIKPEAQRVMVHQVVQEGRSRITVPWLWQGHGEPQYLTLDMIGS